VVLFVSPQAEPGQAGVTVWHVWLEGPVEQHLGHHRFYLETVAQFD
jgi:hypothetical protein